MPTPEITLEPANQATASDTIVVDTSLIEPSTSRADDTIPDSSQIQPTTPSPIITTFEPTRPRTYKPYDTSKGVDPGNIIQEQRAPKPRQEAYLATLQELDELIPYYTVFTVTRLTIPKKRLYRDKLPLVPQT